MVISRLRSFAWGLACLTTTLAGCSHADSADSKALVFADFDQFAGWVPASSSLTTDFAHSGKYSIRGGKDVEYSLSFCKTLGLISPKRFQKVKLSAWVYLADANAGEAQLVLALHDPSHENQQIFSVGFPLKEQVKAERKWEQVTKEITLPATADFGNEMRIFLWRASAGSYAYLDDLRLDVVE